MSLSLYDLSIPFLLRGLGVLSDYMGKAAAYAADNNINPTVLINARLAPDMLPLAGQVQRASDSSKGGVARLAAVDSPSFPDNESSFEELKTRIAKTVAFLETIDPKQLEGSEARPIDLKFGSVVGAFRGDRFLLQILIPNFFFHIATAHDILRHNGLKIGKKDYFGAFA